MPKEIYTVELERPAGATVRDTAAYIKDAVETWQGQLRPPGSYNEYDPGHPLFGAFRKGVIVRRRYP